MKKIIVGILLAGTLVGFCMPLSAQAAAKTNATSALLSLLQEKVDTYGYAPSEYDWDYKGRDVLYAHFADFDEDGQKELFIAYYINTISVSYEIWGWNGSAPVLWYNKVGLGGTKWTDKAYCSIAGSGKGMQYVALTEDDTGKAYFEWHDIYGDDETTYYTYLSSSNWWFSSIGLGDKKTKPVWKYYGELDFRIHTTESVDEVKDLLKGSATGMYSDIEASAWYNRSVGLSTINGLMGGTGGGVFNPNGLITLDQALAMACRLHDSFNGGNTVFSQKTPWYQVYVDYAVQNGIISNGEYANLSTPATRSQMAHILTNAVPKSKLNEINKIDAVPDVGSGDSNADDILLLYRAGILTGDSVHAFKPDSNISRAEAATIIVRFVLPTERQSFTIK